jgi:cytochrome c-type biogenesis protein CcmF
VFENSAFNIPQSPIAALGTVILLVSYLVAAYGAATGLVGNVRQRRRLVNSSVYALYGLFALMIIASALMIYAFVTHDYTIKYVSRYSDTTMGLAYKITAYWGGLDGSLLFWVAVLSAFSAVAVWANHRRHRDMIGYVVSTVLIVQLFFLSILIYAKNPFATYLTEPPMDGEGLNPLLQNYWMVIHPPSLYLGFVAATVPFAFGIAALASGRLDDQWLGSVRSWMMICWFFLSLGLILGGRWAYEELGWGGYWAWDPVENAGFLPWFTAGAFLHSIMIQEQRGMFKIWNIVLVVLTFFLTIVGTFWTRSGVVQSVHAFGEDNELALLFILFMALIAVVSMGLILYRAPKLRSTNTFESFVSREYAFLLNNWVLLACCLFVFFTTMFPTFTELFTGERITIGIAFYNRWMTPLGLILLFLAGAAPLLAWRRTTSERLQAQFLFPVAAFVITIAALALLLPQTRVRTTIFSGAISLPVSLLNFGLIAFVFSCVGQEFYKGVRVRMRQSGSGPMTSLFGLILSKRRKYGGYVIHLAVAVMFLGFAGKAYETMEDYTVSEPRESFQVGGYTFVYDELITEATDHKTSITAHVSLYDKGKKVASYESGEKIISYEKGDKIASMDPAKWHFVKSEQPTTEVSMHHKMREDIYLILTGHESDTKLANFRVYINPLINWVWLGFGFLMLGTAICLFPQRVVDSLSPRRRTRAGRGVEAGIMVLIVVALSVGFTKLAQAQGPPAEHEDQSAIVTGGHSVTAGVAHECRPDSPTAKALMKELVCTCGGCKRETLFECRCGFAADARCKVLSRLSDARAGLAGQGLSESEVESRSYQTVIDSFVKEFGGEHVLSTPKSKLTWLVPYIAIGGGLVLLFAFGRRWVLKGRQAVQARAAEAKYEEDEEYAEILDDELRDTD